MSFDFERYRIFKNVSETETLLRKLIDQQTVLLNQMQELLSTLREGVVTRPFYVPRALDVTGSCASLSLRPVELVGSKRLVLDPSWVYRYELARSDVITVVSLDDNLLFSPREFTDDSGAIPLPARAMLQLRRPKSWRAIWLRPESTTSRVYVSEWVYVDE